MVYAKKKKKKWNYTFSLSNACQHNQLIVSDCEESDQILKVFVSFDHTKWFSLIGHCAQELGLHHSTESVHVFLGIIFFRPTDAILHNIQNE